MSVSTVTGMFTPPPPAPPMYVPPEPLAPGRTRPPTPNHTWAWLYAALGGVLVTGYFFLASIVAVMTLDGDPSEAQEAQSAELLSAAGVALLATGVGAWLTHLVVRWADGHDRSGTALSVVVLGWLASFAAAFQAIDLVPSAVRPVAFGAMWAIGGMVVSPAVAAAVAYAGSRRSRNARAKA